MQRSEVKFLQFNKKKKAQCNRRGESIATVDGGEEWNSF